MQRRKHEATNNMQLFFSSYFHMVRCLPEVHLTTLFKPKQPLQRALESHSDYHITV